MATMARWEPNARGRLEKAAMELFQERGYVRTTVEDIAAHAGLTERTFFRYFADKREVLFAGSKELEKCIVAHMEGAPRDAGPFDATTAAFEAAGAELEQRRDLHFVRARYALVIQHAEIQERELIKLASLATAVTKALRARGVREPAASLAAEAGVAVFKIGFERWVGEFGHSPAAAQKPTPEFGHSPAAAHQPTPQSGRSPRDFAAHIRAAANTLRVIATEQKVPRTRAKKKPAHRP
jgi:AcrR family transcriptional regulator